MMPYDVNERIDKLIGYGDREAEATSIKDAMLTLAREVRMACIAECAKLEKVEDATGYVVRARTAYEAMCAIEAEILVD